MDPFNFSLPQDTSRLRDSAQLLFNSDPFNIKHDAVSHERQQNQPSINLSNYRNQSQQVPLYLPYPQQQQQHAFYYGASPYSQSNSGFKGMNSAPVFISNNGTFNMIPNPNSIPRQDARNSSQQSPRQENVDSNPNSPFSSDEEQVPVKREVPIVQLKPRPAARSRGGRIQWTPELHDVFEECVEALGVAATAKNVMTLMAARGADIGNLTRVRVANHLQYYNSRRNKSIVSKLSDKALESQELTG